jgi:hypothetical protein
MEEILGKSEKETLELWTAKYPTKESWKAPTVTLGERLLITGSLITSFRQHSQVAEPLVEDELLSIADRLEKVPWRQKTVDAIRGFLCGKYPGIWNLTLFNIAMRTRKLEIVEAAILECPRDDPRYLWNFICAVDIDRKATGPVSLSPLEPLIMMAFSVLPMDEETKEYLLGDKFMFPLLLNCVKLTDSYHKTWYVTRRRYSPVYRLLKQRHKSRHPLSLEEVAYLANARGSEAQDILAETVVLFWASFAQQEQIRWVIEVMHLKDPHREALRWVLRARLRLDQHPGDYVEALKILGIKEEYYGDDQYSYIFCMLEAHRNDDEPFGEEAKRYFSSLTDENRAVLLVSLGFAIHSSSAAKRPLTLAWLNRSIM